MLRPALIGVTAAGGCRVLRFSVDAFRDRASEFRERLDVSEDGPNISCGTSLVGALTAALRVAERSLMAFEQVHDAFLGELDRAWRRAEKAANAGESLRTTSVGCGTRWP